MKYPFIGKWTPSTTSRFLLASTIVGLPLGCTPEKKDTEVSAATSGFRPAESGTGKSSTVNSTASSSDSKGQGTPSKGGEQPEAAPPLPSFTPGQLDPAVAAKSYMILSMPKTLALEEIAPFIRSIDRAMQDLQKDVSQRLVNNEIVLNRGMDLSRMKLQAADQLVKMASTPEQTAAGQIGKLEALQQMAMFRDVSSEDDLRALSKDLMKNDDPKVAIAANKIQLQLALAEYRSQTATADQVLELAKGLLSKTEIPDRSTFVALAQAASMLGADEPGAPKPEGSEKTEGGENGLGKKVDELVDALEAKFRDVPDPNIGMMAWRLKVQRLPNFESYLQVLDTSQAMRAEPEALTAAAKGLMEKIPSPWTALALSECATQFEYSGKVDVAKNLFELASTQLEKTKISGLKQQLQQMSEGFNKRSGAIGKPLPMEKLVDTKGAPLDLTKYEGKVILVDFWATWCGPCVQEIPNIKKVYEEKHAEGFEVIAINLDDDRSDLDKFLSENEMPWSVFVSSDPEKVGMKSQLVEDLAITAIPFTMVIGRDGKVAAIHIRGQELGPKVQELLTARTAP